MIDAIKEVIRPLMLDENILVVAIYRIDGTPIVVESKEMEKILEVIYWLEKQIQTLLYYISAGLFNDAEFRFRDYYVLLYPISRTLVLGIIANEEVSAYKIRIDSESIKETLSGLVI